MGQAVRDAQHQDAGVGAPGGTGPGGVGVQGTQRGVGPAHGGPGDLRPGGMGVLWACASQGTEGMVVLGMGSQRDRGAGEMGCKEKGVPRKGVPGKRVPGKGVPRKGVSGKGVPGKGVPVKGVPGTLQDTHMGVGPDQARPAGLLGPSGDHPLPPGSVEKQEPGQSPALQRDPSSGTGRPQRPEQCQQRGRQQRQQRRHRGAGLGEIPSRAKGSRSRDRGLRAGIKVLEPARGGSEPGWEPLQGLARRGSAGSGCRQTPPRSRR